MAVVDTFMAVVDLLIWEIQRLHSNWVAWNVIHAGSGDKKSGFLEIRNLILHWLSSFLVKVSTTAIICCPLLPYLSGGRKCLCMSSRHAQTFPINPVLILRRTVESTCTDISDQPPMSLTSLDIPIRCTDISVQPPIFQMSSWRSRQLRQIPATHYGHERKL